MPRKSLRVGERGTINTLKLEKGKWRARCLFRDADGIKKPMSRYGRTKGAAEGRLKDDWLDYSKTIMTGRVAVTNPITVNVLFDQWMDEEWKVHSSKGYPAASTLRNRHSLFMNHILPRIGEVPVNLLSTGRLNSVLADIPESNGSYMATAVQARAALMVFCHYAVTHELLGANIARETNAIGYQPPEPRPLTAEEISKLRHLVSRWQMSRANIRVPVLDVIDFMLGTGCRIGEALGIQWEHVHLNDPVPWVRIEFAVVYGRHNPSAIGKTKAKKVLHVALPIFAAEMLYRRWAAAGYQDEGLVFHRRSGKAYAVTDIHQAAKRAIGDDVIAEHWEGGFKSHSLRKAVLNSVNDRFGLSAAAEQGGHSSESTTKKYYLAPNVKTINYTESLHQLLGMQTPVLADVPEEAEVVDSHVEQPEWIPADVRRVAEALLRGDVPEGVVMDMPSIPREDTPLLTSGVDDESIVDEEPVEEENPVASSVEEHLDPAEEARQYWVEARKHASRARARDNGGGVVVIDHDTQSYSPLKPGRHRIGSTDRLRKIKVPAPSA